MIDASDLAAMRAQMSETHTETLVLYRRAKVSDSQGGYTTSYTAVTGGTALARVYQVSGLERAFAQRQGTVSLWRIGWPLTPEVLASDRFYAGTMPVYEVTSGNLPRSLALEQVVDVVRI